jgi:hypothetical protein
MQSKYYIVVLASTKKRLSVETGYQDYSSI